MMVVSQTVKILNNAHEVAEQISLHAQGASSVLIVTDTATSRFCYPEIRKWLTKHTLVELLPGEMHKNLDSVGQIINALLAQQADRHALIVNLGGGMLADIGGFAASIFMRGIRFINVPTTLLAMVDASVGGKTAINYGPIKNLVGTFHQPEEVIVCPAWLETLPVRERNSGYAEMLKHALLDNSQRFIELAEAIKAGSLTHASSLYWIKHSIGLKSDIVTKDYKETSLRAVLNLGHTTAHALEGWSNANEPEHNCIIKHGEAVLLGMYVESCFLNAESKVCDYLHELIKLMIPKVVINSIKKADEHELLIFMQADKKNKQQAIKISVRPKRLDVESGPFTKLITNDQAREILSYLKDL